MRVPPTVAHRVRAGEVTVAYRRWRVPAVRPGQQFRTAAGVLRIESVTEVDPTTIGAADAAAAGHESVAALHARLASDTTLATYRVGLAWAGEDPRVALREDADLSAADVADIDIRLARLDRASRHGPWTMSTLRLIARRPHVRAPDLAAELGRERDPFKIDVRKLKNLGLTRSFDVGYDVSPRGRAYLAHTTRTG